MHTHAHPTPTSETPAHAQGHRPYLRLLWMVLGSFVLMYILMYAMVNEASNVYNNINEAYMAGLMAAPMALLELAFMRHMYPDGKANALVSAGAVAVTVACWLLIRSQGGVGDRQFLRSMIPHHSGAILMCGKASISDPGIKDLCGRIIAGQQSEIDEMRAALARLKRE